MKRWVVCVLLLCMLTLPGGCGADAPEESTVSPEQSTASSSPTAMDMNPLRLAINTLSMYHDLTGNEDEIVLRDVKKYGIETFSRYDDWYPFYSVDDMSTVLGNADFQQAMESRYQIDTLPDAYYLPDLSKMRRDTEWIDADFIVIEQAYHLNIQGMHFSKGIESNVIWGVFAAQQPVDVQAVAEYYAGLDGLSVVRFSREGNAVYELFAEHGGTLFEDMGYGPDDAVTAYLWEQNGVIGVLILPGEHKDENLDLCVLERHEI